MPTRPEQFHRELLDYHRSLAPTNGTAFHVLEDLELFRSTDPRTYLPNQDVIDQLCGLYAVAILSGPAGAGKDGAKKEAVSISASSDPWDNVPLIHPVINWTTRLPEFRDRRVEQHKIDYLFAHDFENNRAAAQALREGRIVQFAQPRGDHVYFTDAHCFPSSGVALMDAVPDTVRDMNRILGNVGKSAIAMYRTVDSFAAWMARLNVRGDVFGPDGEPIDMDNYRKRMKEAAESLTKAMDSRTELDIRFFEAEELPEAGKAVIDIIMDRHSEDMQQRGIKGAELMLAGLAEKGFKVA
jgi:hypothetical protein